jgi:diguanylate cyclase (GGDEF)-like protein
VGTDITGEVERDARILHLATRDALTGLRNRASLADEAAVLLDALADERADAALLLIDLAGFREINETFGAEIGDALLREFACRMRALGAADGAAGGGGLLLARVGGDEFAVLLPRALDARRQAAELADGLKSAASNPFRLQGRELRAQIQVGVALFPQDGGGLDELLGAAGLALALAREGAGGTTSFFDPGIRLGMARRWSMEQALRRAVEGGALHFALQPQAALADGALVGCEALLRWQNPELGPVRPDVFVPVAEETGLIQPIGYWLLEEACRAALPWPGRGRHATIAVNVSPLQLLDPGFVRGVEATLAVTGLPAGRLELEITEGIFVRDNEAVLATLNGLREMGVALAIDDFGTGYSSLGYLKRFPVAKLKIDRAFVKDLDESAGDRALTAAIVGVSRALGLKTVAEGIETEGQWRFLRDQGCDVGQGYLFGRPLTPEAFAALWAPRSAGGGTS